MKLSICLLLCLGTAAFSYMPESLYEAGGWTNDQSVIGQAIEEQKEFRYGRELKYVYNGQVMTGIPGTSKQHSGNRIKAIVKFVCKNEETCIMKIEQIRTGKLNRRVKQPRHVLPINAFDEIPLDFKQREKLHLPIKFSNSKGLITNIIFDGRERPWSANIKRGILHMIQVDLQQKKHGTSMDVIDIVEDEFVNTYKPTERDAHFYRTLEETIEGQCETFYTVTKPQVFKSNREDVFNVTKTVNFEKCLKRPQIKYNFHFSEPCPTSESKYNEDQKFLKSSSISQYQVIKTSRLNIINNAQTESEYIFTPLNEEANAIVTYVSQNLKLIKTGVASNYVQVPKHPKKSDSDMIFTLDQQIAAETFRMEGNSKELQDAQDHKGQQNKIQMAKTLLLKLTNNIREQVEQPATKHFIQLVRLLKLMSKTEIDQLHNIVENRAALSASPMQWTHQEQKRAKDLLHDAIGTAGTKACVKHLCEKTKQHEISIVKAVSSIKNLMSMHTPSKEIIEELIKLAESPVAERHYMLKQATWLTIGTLMKSLCANNEDQWAREFKEKIQKFCPKTLKQQYVKILLKKVHSTHKWDEQLIYVKALGNAGIDLSVFEIEKIINNKNFNYPTIVRVEAVLALRKLQKVMPKKIQKVLMPVVSNKMQPQTLRVAAAYMVLQTLPNRPVLDQLAKIVQDERSIQVSSFIFSYMDNLANSTNPCERKLATDLKLSMRQTHKIYSRALGNSKSIRYPMHSRHHKVGLDLELTSSFAEGRKIPRQVAATLHSNFLGFWNKYLVSFRLATEGLEKVMRDVHNRFGYFNEFGGESFFANEYENMFTPAGIFGQQVHDVRSKDPKVVFNLKIKNQDVGFLPIKRNAIENFLLNGRLSGQMRHLEQQLRQGMPVNYNKATLLENILYEIPTTIGMPVYVDVKVPVVLNVHGAVKVTPLSGALSGDFSKFQVKAVIKPSLVASVNIEVAAWSPIVSTGVNVVSKIKAFKPIDAKVLVDLKRETKIVKILFKPPTHKKDLITVESTPYTFTQIRPKQMKLVESPQKRMILNEEGVRTRTIHQCTTSRFTGLRFCVKGRYHKTPEHRETNAPFIPFSGPNKVVISTEPSVGAPRTIAINIFAKFFKPLSSWNIGSRLNAAQRYFLNIVTNEYDYTSTGSPLSSFGGVFDEINTPFTGAGVDPLMAQAASYNTHKTANQAVQAKNVKKPVLNSLRVQIEAAQRYTTFDFAHIFNFDGDYHKVQAKFSRSPVPEEPQPWKLCLNAETILPTLKMIQDLPNGEVLGMMDIHWGQSCSSSKYIHVIKRLEKNYQPRTFDLQNPEWKLYKDSNMYHDQLLEKSPIKYIFNIKYQNVPLKAKHYGNELLRLIKKRHYDQTNVAEVAVQNRPQQIKVVVAVDPVTLKKCDILVKTPKSNTLIRDVSLPSYACPISHKHDYAKNEKKSLTRESLFQSRTAQCYASEINVKTFHDRELPLPLSHSFKVLSKDCQNNKYTVLVRQLTDMPQLKEVKIITQGNQITLKPSLTRKDKTKVFVNGKDQTLQNDIVKTVAGVPILRIIRQSAHVKVEILTAGVSIYFDRKSVNVEVPPQKRHNQCGLCGTQSFAGLRQEFPTYLQQSPILNEIEQQYFNIERNTENYNGLEQELAMENAGGLFPQQLTNPFYQPYGYGPENAFRDYSNMDDAFGYYFNYNKPTSRLWQNEEQLLEEELFNNQPFETINEPSQYNQFNQYNEYNTQFGGKLDSNNQAWNRQSQRNWEVEQLVSKSNPNPTYETLRDLQKINAEFDTFYSPVSSIEQEIEANFAGEQQGLYSTIINPFEEQQFVEQEYFSNPYLNKNFLINEQACQYLPFWQRKVQGCDDIFAQNIYEQEQGLLGNNAAIFQNELIENIENQLPIQNWENLQEMAYTAGNPLAFQNTFGYENELAIENQVAYESGNPLAFQKNAFGYENELAVENQLAYESENQLAFQEAMMYGQAGQNIVENEIINEQMIGQGLGVESELIGGQVFGSQNEIGLGFSGQATTRKQKIIETEHSICFSLIPIKCKDQTYPKDGVKQQVPYHCMNRKNPLAQKYQNEIVSGRSFVPALQTATPTMSRIEVVPVKCQPVY